MEGNSDNKSEPQNDVNTTDERQRSRSRSRSPIRGNKGGISRRSGGGSSGGGDDRFQRMVHVSNVPYNVKWMEMKDLIRQYVGEPAFVEMLESRDGKSKGAAIVQFRNDEDLRKCCDSDMVMNERHLKCNEIRDPKAFFRKVEADTGRDFMGGTGGGGSRGSGRRDFREPAALARGARPATGTYDLFGLSPDFLSSIKVEPPLQNRVFIANLPFNVQAGEIHDIFSMAGTVTWVDLTVDKEGRQKGFGVVEFAHPVEAVQAVAMFDQQILIDRRMGVRMDKLESQRVKPSPSRLPPSLRGIGAGLGPNGEPLINIAEKFGMGNGNSNNGPMMGNMGMNRPAAFVNPPMGIDNNSGFGQNSYVPPAVVTPQPSPYQQNPYQQQQAQQSQNFGGYNAASAPSGFMDRNPMQQGGVGGNQPSRTIVIRNLPTDYTWQMVKERLSRMGEVEYCDMVHPGVSRVSFRTVETAKHVCDALQGSVVEGRQIGLSYD